MFSIFTCATLFKKLKGLKIQYSEFNNSTSKMRGFNFSKYNPNENSKSPFEKLLDLFLQLLTYTNGDFNEAMQWLNELDKDYTLTTPDYGIGDFLEDLKHWVETYRRTA